MERPDIKNEIMGMRALLNQTDRALETPRGRFAVGLPPAGCDAVLSDLERIETGISAMIQFDPFTNLKVVTRSHQGTPHGPRRQRQGDHRTSPGQNPAATIADRLLGHPQPRHPGLLSIRPGTASHSRGEPSSQNRLRPQNPALAPTWPEQAASTAADSTGNRDAASRNQPDQLREIATRAATSPLSPGIDSSHRAFSPSTKQSGSGPTGHGRSDHNQRGPRPTASSGHSAGHPQPATSLAERRRQARLAMIRDEQQFNTGAPTGGQTDPTKPHNYSSTLPRPDNSLLRASPDKPARALPTVSSRPRHQHGASTMNTVSVTTNGVTGPLPHSRPLLDLRPRPIPALPESIDQGLQLFNTAYEQGVDLT